MFPRMHLVHQKFLRPKITDIQEKVFEQMSKFVSLEKMPKGSKIGITAGSRGINNIVTILQSAVLFLKEHGYNPVIISAMGSHGGGTADGQLNVLGSLGITPESMGVPILAGVDCREVGETALGQKAYMNKLVFDTDGIIVINRLKSHTALTGDIQSGILKTCVVGLGGPSGAKQFHSLGPKQLPRALRDIGSILLEQIPIIGGIAIIENGYEETAYIESIEGHKILEEEPVLFRKSLELMPRLPVDHLDVLIIEQMGKNFSGSGIDTNIVGRFRVQGEPEPTIPNIKRIAILDLSEESHGNANGVGLADFTTMKLVKKIDFESTYLNCMTSTFVQRCFVPLYFETERKTIEMAINSLGSTKTATDLRLAIIPNTLHLESVYVSEAILPELLTRDDIEISHVGGMLDFEKKGNLKNRIGNQL